MRNAGLYFIALIPPPKLREQVKALKEDMKKRFMAGHALKSPAHITLQMPFKRKQTEEEEVMEALRLFSLGQDPFPVVLSGFDSFAPRVIYLKIEDHQPVIQLHERLRSMLIRQLNFHPDEVSSRFHPHMTIATRDLHRKEYHRAWAELKDQTFTAAFEVNRLFLLKHNGKSWDIYREFLFEKD